MAFRVYEMTLGGKLSLGYLCISSFLFVTGGRSSVTLLEVFGFPLLYAPNLFEQFFDFSWRPEPRVGITVGMLLWVANAYLWGHIVAAVVRIAGLPFRHQTEKQDMTMRRGSAIDEAIGPPMTKK